MDTIKITTPAGSPIEITPLSESYARTALQEIDTLVLHYELPEHTDLPLGSTASFRGTTYTLYKTSDLTMHHSRAYEYTATLYGDGERTRLYKVANLVDGRLSFTLTAKPHEHLQMLVDTLNKREGAGTWTRGSVPDGTEITIAYDHISVLDALVQLATKLETEWGITGTTLHIGKLTSSSDPLSLRYGRGKGILPDIRRTPVDDYPIGRLYANGGSRNIDPSAYGSKTLHFPKGATLTYEGQVYHTDPTGTYVYTEGAAATSSDTSIDLTHIYPSRIRSVTKVEVTKEGAVDILDSTIPETLDYEKQLLEGQTLTVKFETGMLAGREPFGAKYIHRDRRFQIVPRDEDGITLPGGVYLPKEGDKYAVFGCSLPLQYISDAETAMLSEAVKYLHSHQTEQYNITIELDGIYTKQHWGEIGSRLALGHRVRFTDPSWQPTPVDIRILGITTYLSRPYSPKLDLSNSPLPSSFTAVIKRVEGDQLVREEEYRGGLRRLEKRTYEDAKATREMIERLRVEGFTHSITPETLRTLQAVIGSPSLQFSFGRDDGQELFPFEYEWRKGKTELHIPGRQYILQEKGDKTLSPDAKQKVTEMAEYTYSLKDEETQLYLYADLTEQSYKVSATPMEITDTRLLVALIHGVGEDRTLTPLYGFTEITPGQLKTDLIRSQDGKSYWDLLTGKFATKGDLLIGDPKGNTCLAYIDGVLYVKGLTVNVGSSSTTIEDALLEQERKLKDAEEARAKAETEQKREIENAKKVRQPIIKNGTWWVWDDTTNQLIDSGKPAQGANGKDATPVRDNLFTAKLYTFSQNDYYGAKRTHLGDGRWRVEKVAKSDKKWFDGASFYVSPIRDTKPGRYTISFRVVETSRPIKSNGTAIGDRYISTVDSDDGRLPGFDFYWGETSTKGNEIGDYTIIDQVKIERVAEGEDPMPTAYLPHPLDLKGEPGKDVDPKVLNDLKTAVDDARRKLDDTATKAELDGVVSAQEKKDIQAAKAALDAAKKAYDDAVKRAKELDGEIRVGGRNLLLKSDTAYSNTDYRVALYDIADPSQMIAGETYTIRIWGEAEGADFSESLWVYNSGGNVEVANIQQRTNGAWTQTFKWRDDLDKNNSWLNIFRGANNPAYNKGSKTTITRVKLERGTVATDWTPATEDVQSEIDAAKEQATKAQTSTDKLRGYVDGAYKDGIITEVESKAIATYINEVEAMWSSAFGAYERVYTNTLLIGAPKTALSDAKITLAGAKDNLIGQIKRAISDGKATKAEATETERLYNVYKGALRDFQRALKAAEESIRDAGKTTGGRNLVVMSRMIPGYLYGDTKRGNPGDRDYKVMQYKDFIYDPTYYEWDGATPLTFKLYKGGISAPIIHYHDKDKVFIGWSFDWMERPAGYTKTLTPPAETAYIRIGFPCADPIVKLERGVVATDWTPAPDDLQAAIDKVERGYQKLIERIDVEFAVSSSRTTAPASGWQTTAPTTTKGQALWQRTKVYLKDGTTEVRGTTCIQGRDGTDGRDGGKGADGRGITAVKELYYLSTSNTELKGGTWSETAPTPREGCWIWTMTRIYYTTGTPTTTTKPICVTGAKGDTGAKGEKGDGLDIIDTRNDNQPPSWYREKYALTTVREFKKLSPIEIPSKWWSGYYCTLETTVRWGDTSGGRVEQSTTLDNGLQLRRVGTSDDTAWEPWINVSAEIREVATGLSSANTLIQSLEKAQEMLDTGKLNKADLPDVQYLLDSLKNGATSKKGGLLLTNDIILSDPNSKDVTASISGTRTRGAKAIRLGIKYSGDHVDYLFNAPFFNAEYNNLTNLEDDNAREKRINELGYSVAEYNKFLRNWRVYPTAEKKEVGETSAFFNDGKAHIGDLFFNGEYISFGTDKDSYMQIGGSAKPESEMVSASTEIRKFGIASRTLTKSGIATLDMFDSRYSNREIKYTANLSVFARAMAYEVPNKGDWDPVHHRYDTPAYRTYESVESSATAQLKLELSRGGSVIKTVTSPEVSVRAVAQGGQFANNEQVPQGKLYADDRKSQAVIITISPSDVRMYDTVTLSLITTARKYCFKLSSSKVDRYAETSASAENIINYLPYDTSTPMVSVTKDKAAFFYGRSKYVLLNYLESCVMKVVGNMIIQGNLTVKGDLKTEYADFPGAPLCGGMVTENGSYKKSFGRYKNQSGRNIPQVSYDYSTKVYTVYHSIGNDRYIPSLAVYGPEGMSRCLCIMSVDSYSFKVKAYNSGNWEQAKAGFSYVCFKA